MNTQKRTTIKSTLVFWFLALSAIPLLINSAINHLVFSNTIEKAAIENLVTEAREQSQSIKSWFDYRFMDVNRLAMSPKTVETLEQLSQNFQILNRPLNEYVNSFDWEQIAGYHRAFFMNQWLSYDFIYDIFIIDKRGNLLFSVAKENDLGTNLITGKYKDTRFSQVVQQAYQTGYTLFSDLERYEPSANGVYGFIASPIIDNAGHKIGSFAIQIKLDRLDRVLTNNNHNQTQTFLTSKDGEYRSTVNNKTEDTLVKALPFPNDNEKITADWLDQNVSAYNTKGVNNEQVISLHMPVSIGGVDWKIVNQTPVSVINEPLNNQLALSSFLLLVTLIIVASASLSISFSLADPIKKLASIVEHSGDKNADLNVEIKSNNEIQMLSIKFKEMIEERQRYEQKLQTSLSYQNAILDNLGEALIIISSKGIVQRFGASASKLFGFQENEVIGNNISMLMPKQIAQHHDSYLQNFDPTRADSKIAANRELKGLHKSGQEFDIELVVTSVIIDNDRVFIGLISDVTERLKMQAELYMALKAAGEANKAKSDFLANMSHEIRTPMNGIYGTLQLLNKSQQSAEDKTLISRALSSSESLLTIINDILDFSKIEAGKLTLENVPFSASELAQRVVSDLSLKTKEKNLELVLHDKQGNNVGWLGDPVRVGQILLNISSNAVKFTESGSITITLSVQEQQLIMLVEDTGIGMNKESVEALFERFSQADSTTTRLYGGTGLGMAITKLLVDMMEGTVTVTSEEGQGSVFSIHLPLQQIDLKTDKAQIEEKTECPDLQGKTILLAEDNKVNQAIFNSMIKPANAKVIIAENGQQAVDKMEEHQPDLIFMDIQMPVMDGVEACILIKGRKPNLPVIALTANVMQDDVKLYNNVGFNDHIGKPIVLEKLYGILDKYLS